MAEKTQSTKHIDFDRIKSILGMTEHLFVAIRGYTDFGKAMIEGLLTKYPTDSLG